MARNLTEDEVKFIEERRKQQQEQSRRDEFEGGMSGEELEAIDKRRQEMAEGWRKARVSAMGDAARGWRRGQAERDADERRHWDDLHRETHGGLSRSEVLALGPDGSGRQARGIARAAELQTAREHEAGMKGRELDTRLKEAEQKRLGMKEQGSDAAAIRAKADKDMLGLTLGDKEKQREHERTMLGQQQTFQGAQNTAERQNRLDIAKTQGSSAVDVATVQAQAQEARIYAENLMKTRNLDQRQAMQFARMREQKINKIMEQRRSKQTGKYTITREEAAKMADEELENQGLPGTARKTLADFGA